MQAIQGVTKKNKLTEVYYTAAPEHQARVMLTENKSLKYVNIFRGPNTGEIVDRIYQTVKPLVILE